MTDIVGIARFWSWILLAFVVVDLLSDTDSRYVALVELCLAVAVRLAADYVENRSSRVRR